MIERAPVAEGTRRSSDLIVQGVFGGVVVVSSTAAAIAGVLSSDALAGIYAAALGYIFGVGNGARLATR